MASNSFKVKNSLVLTPKDLSTLTNPEAGDLACDINDNNKIKRYDETLADWVEVGSGAGGGLDVFHTDDFDDIKNVSSFSTGNNASFLGGGTLAGGLSLESVSPISGINSLKYTQASSSLNDYFASEIIDVDLKQQNNTSGMTLYFTYDGDANDGRFIVWDVTNDQEISNQLALVETASKATRYSLSFHVPASCTQIRWGYQVLVENVGAVLLVDDVEMSSDPFIFANLKGVTAEFETEFSASIGDTSTASPRAINHENVSGWINSVTRTGVGAYVIDYSNLNLTEIPVIDAHSEILAYEASVGSITTTSASIFVQAISNGNATDRPIAVTLSKQGDDYLSAVQKKSEHILTPSDTFSTDTAPLTYAPSSQYTLSTLEDAPVGTFITFTYAANTNTRTQTTTAPSQSTADMNQNGIQIFTRAFNAASTAGNPAAIAIQIGKGLKGKSLDLYKSTGKATSGSIERDTYDNGVISEGLFLSSYDEKTGILYLDAGFQYAAVVLARFKFSDLTFQNNGYLVINASKTLPLLAVPTPKVAYLKDVKPSGTAGGTFTSGAWQTRTLNTVEGDFNKFGTLSGNQFTLQPGKYEIEASAPASYCQNHKIKLRNITDSTDQIMGTSEQQQPNTASNDQNRSFLSGTINITQAKVFEIQHRCALTRGIDGFGVASNFVVSEVYTIVKITKLS